MVARFYWQDRGLRRAMLLAGGLGGMLVALQPPLPIQVRGCVWMVKRIWPGHGWMAPCQQAIDPF